MYLDFLFAQVDFLHQIQALFLVWFRVSLVGRFQDRVVAWTETPVSPSLSNESFALGLTLSSSASVAGPLVFPVEMHRWASLWSGQRLHTGFLLLVRGP